MGRRGVQWEAMLAGAAGPEMQLNIDQNIPSRHQIRKSSSISMKADQIQNESYK